MMRALHEKLAIPADVLLGRAKAKLPEPCPNVEWKSFPTTEMFNLVRLGKVKPKVDEIEVCV
ncbi:MAG: hypothetical protein ACI9RO_001326 [Alteromonas macleodii]|jgi:hypothetical protein